MNVFGRNLVWLMLTTGCINKKWRDLSYMVPLVLVSEISASSTMGFMQRPKDSIAFSFCLN